jgi:hypothetical protein
MALYTFHLRRSDETATALDIVDLSHDAAAFQRAGRLLDEHQTCDRVEIWDGERPVVARHRDEPIIRPIEDGGFPSLGRRTSRPSAAAP